MNQRLRLILINAGLVLAGLLAGGLVGVLIAAPSATDIRNACVADQVVPRAGVPGQIAPGPADAPYSDPRTLPSTPRPKSGPFPEHRRDSITTTPQVVTPLGQP